MRILLIEDDPLLSEVVSQALAHQRYVIDWVEDGQAGWEYAQTTTYDLIVMDVGLPRLDGITLCQRLRSSGCTTPILLMTAKDASSERIRGLDAGADDYLVKPLDLAELQARVRALLRRGQESRSPVLQIGALRLDPKTCEVTYADRRLSLTPKEYSLLELLLRNPERVFSRGEIVEHLWTFDDPPLEESVKAHIKGLRQKLKAAGAVDWIENVYGLGYRLKAGLKASAANAAEQPEPGRSQPSVEQQFNQAMDELWSRYAALMQERLAILQQAAAALPAPPAELRQAAVQAAHKLAGVLGMFDREAGTTAARQLEQLFQTDSPPSKQVCLQVQILERLILPPASEAIEPVVVLPLPEATSTQAMRSSVKVLVVDDDPVLLAALKPVLEPWGMQMTGLEQPERFWEVLPMVMPDLLILDVDMPQVGGIELCQAVRNHPEWQGLPILFLTAHRETQTVQQVFAAGADDYITKPVVGAELLTRITHRLERNRLLQTLSTRDPLTGLSNQVDSSRKLEQLLHANGQPISLIWLRVVNLRQIHLRYGHKIGQQVLQQWARLLQTHLGDEAILGYWGDGEFVAGLSGCPTERNDRCSELCRALQQLVVHTPEGDRVEVVEHLALTGYPSQGRSLQQLYQAANAEPSARCYSAHC